MRSPGADDHRLAGLGGHRSLGKLFRRFRLCQPQPRNRSQDWHSRHRPSLSESIVTRDGSVVGTGRIIGLQADPCNPRHERHYSTRMARQGRRSLGNEQEARNGGDSLDARRRTAAECQHGGSSSGRADGRILRSATQRTVFFEEGSGVAPRCHSQCGWIEERFGRTTDHAQRLTECRSQDQRNGSTDGCEATDESHGDHASQSPE